MSSLFRKNQKITTIIFAVVSCIAMISFFNAPSCSRNGPQSSGSDVVGKMYGNPLTKPMLQREDQKAKLAYALKLDLFSALAGRPTTLNEAVSNFMLNSLVLQHEADLLQIEPVGDAVHSDEAVATEIKSLPKFQTEDGQFDPAAYADFVANYLPSLGFDAGDLEDLVAEDLRMKKIKDLLQTTLVVPPEEFRTWYMGNYQMIDVSVIHFNLADFAGKVQVSDDDIKKAFEQNLDGYRSEEKRGIKFVTFSLTDDQKKLTGKERMDALQKLSNSVPDFTQALQAPGAKFDDVAAKFKLTVTDVPPFPQSAPDPKIPQFPAFLETVFQLTKDNPLSDPVQDEETGSFYVIQLQDIQPSRLLTLAEARPQIIDQVKDSRAKEELGVKARDVRNKILADIAAGKSFADAAKAEGLAVETYPPFSLSEPDLEKEDAPQVSYLAGELKEGDVSDFAPTKTGGIIIHVDKREPVDPKQYATDSALLEPTFNQKHVDLVFLEWMRKQHDAANILLNGVRTSATPIPPPPK